MIESPKATSTSVPAGAPISSSSRKYHDVVEKGNAPSPSSPPRGPASGALRYELVRALACHVIGPLSPATWKLTASLRPFRSGSSGDPTNPSLTGSLTTLPPGGTTTLAFPPKVAAVLVPGTIALPLSCSPTNAPSNVTGLVPKALERRMRASLPQTSGRTIIRNDWSRAPRSGEGKANLRSGCAVGLPTG